MRYDSIQQKLPDNQVHVEVFLLILKNVSEKMLHLLLQKMSKNVIFLPILEYEYQIYEKTINTNLQK